MNEETKSSEVAVPKLETLGQCEDVIKRHETEFWKVGEALINIKTRQLWKEEFSGKPYQSWEEYLEKVWGYASKAKQFIQAAKLHTKLIDAGMSEESFKRIAPNEMQANKLARAKSMSDEEAKQFVEKVEEKGEQADWDAASKALDEVHPPKPKPEPKELPPEDRRKSLFSTLEKAKNAFNSKVDSAFEEYGEAPLIDEWLRGVAEEIIEKLDK